MNFPCYRLARSPPSKGGWNAGAEPGAGWGAFGLEAFVFWFLNFVLRFFLFFWFPLLAFPSLVGLGGVWARRWY